MLRSFLFLRHGETDWNLQGRMQGHTDIQLNDRGRQQALSAASFIKNLGVDIIVCSDLVRARETAEIVNATIKKPIYCENRIRERSFGKIEGLTIAEINRPNSSHLFLDNVYQPNGLRFPKSAEKLEDLEKRILEAIKDQQIIFPDAYIIFVSHGGVFKSLSKALTEVEEVSENAVPYRFSREHARWKVKNLTL